MSSNTAHSESVAGHGGEIWNDSVRGDQQAQTFLGTACFLALGALSGENFGKFCAFLAELLEKGRNRALGKSCTEALFPIDDVSLASDKKERGKAVMGVGGNAEWILWTLRGFGARGWAWRVGVWSWKKRKLSEKSSLRDAGKDGEGLELLSMSECQGKQQKAWRVTTEPAAIMRSWV